MVYDVEAISQYEWRQNFRRDNIKFKFNPKRKIIIKHKNLSVFIDAKGKFINFHSRIISRFLEYVEFLVIDNVRIDQCIIDQTVELYVNNVRESDLGRNKIESIAYILSRMIKFCRITRLPIELFDMNRCLDADIIYDNNYMTCFGLGLTQQINRNAKFRTEVTINKYYFSSTILPQVIRLAYVFKLQTIWRFHYYKPGGKYITKLIEKIPLLA